MPAKATTADDVKALIAAALSEARSAETEALKAQVEAMQAQVAEAEAKAVAATPPAPTPVGPPAVAPAVAQASWGTARRLPGRNFDEKNEETDIEYLQRLVQYPQACHPTLGVHLTNFLKRVCRMGNSIAEQRGTGAFEVPEEFMVQPQQFDNIGALYRAHAGTNELDTTLCTHLNEAISGSWRKEFGNLPARYCVRVAALADKLRSAPSVEVATAISGLINTKFTGKPAEFKTEWVHKMLQITQCGVTIEDVCNAIATAAIGERSKLTQGVMLQQVNDNLAKRRADPDVKPVDPIGLVSNAMMSLAATQQSAVVQAYEQQGGGGGGAGNGRQPSTRDCTRCGRVHQGGSTNCWAKYHSDHSKITSPPTAEEPQGRRSPARVQHLEQQPTRAELAEQIKELKGQLDSKRDKKASKP